MDMNTIETTTPVKPICKGNYLKQFAAAAKANG